MKKSLLALGVMLAASSATYADEAKTAADSFDLSNIDKMIDESGVDTSSFNLDNIDSILSGKVEKPLSAKVTSATPVAGEAAPQPEDQTPVQSEVEQVAASVSLDAAVPAKEEIDGIRAIEVGGETIELAETHTEEELMEEEKYRKTFLSNVPSKSIFISNKNFLFQPNREYYMFDDGERVVNNPLSESNKFATFCYFKLTKSNDRVLLPKHDTMGLKITYSESLRHDLKDVVIYAHRFSFAENQRFSSFTCLSSEKNEPLRIEDINYETGDSFKIKFAPVVKAQLFE